MERIRGASAGLLAGALLSPIFCLVTYLLLFFLGILTLTNVELFKNLYRLITAFGNPYVLTVLITCFVSSLLGYTWKWRFFST